MFRREEKAIWGHCATLSNLGAMLLAQLLALSATFEKLERACCLSIYM